MVCTLFAYLKCLGTCDALLCASHILQSALESEQVARIMQINFTAAFDRYNEPGIFYKLCSVAIFPRLRVVFRRIVRLGSFPACWRQVNVTPIPKGPPSSSVANY